MAYHKSPQFSALLENIIKIYDAHSDIALTDEQKTEIKTSIIQNMDQNHIGMKFCAEVAKLNVIIKQESPFSAEDNLAVRAAIAKFRELKDEYPEHADLFLASTSRIFDPDDINIPRREEVLEITADIDPDIEDYITTTYDSEEVDELTLAGAEAEEIINDDEDSLSPLAQPSHRETRPAAEAEDLAPDNFEAKSTKPDKTRINLKKREIAEHDSPKRSESKRPRGP